MAAEATTDAGTENGSGETISVSDQISLNGMVMVDSVTADAAGWRSTLLMRWAGMPT